MKLTAVNFSSALALNEELVRSAQLSENHSSAEESLDI